MAIAIPLKIAHINLPTQLGNRAIPIKVDIYKTKKGLRRLKAIQVDLLWHSLGILDFITLIESIRN